MYKTHMLQSPHKLARAIVFRPELERAIAVLVDVVFVHLDVRHLQIRTSAKLYQIASSTWKVLPSDGLIPRNDDNSGKSARRPMSCTGLAAAT